MENSVIITKDGKTKIYELPEYGTIKIIIQNGKPERVDRNIQEKI